MAKFVFKLQALLNLKEQMETSLKNELGKAVQKLEEEKQRLRAIEEERDMKINAINEEASRGIQVGRLKEYSYYIGSFKAKIEKQGERINQASRNVDKYREELMKAVQERKMLEKLREKKYTEYMKEYYKKEQSNVDERVSFNYSLNSGQ